MEAKKNPKYDINRRRPMFFFIGLTITLSLVIAAFEWKTVDTVSRLEIDGNMMQEDIIEVRATIQPPPPPPPKQLSYSTIKEVSDDEDLSEEIEIEIDVEVNEQTVVNEIQFEMKEEEEEEKVEEVFMIVESMPTPVGGYEGFYSFISKNLRYPGIASRNGIQGKIFIQFVVDSQGKISDPKIIRGLGYGCDEEALRVVNLGYDWKPGEQRGKPVSVRMMLPIYFKLTS